MNSGFKGVWQTPTLRKLVAARFISNLGNGLGPIAIPFGVLGLPHGTPTSLSLVWLSTMLPLTGFMLIGGVIGDVMGGIAQSIKDLGPIGQIGMMYATAGLGEMVGIRKEGPDR